MAWGKLGSTTLGSANNSISFNIDGNKFLTVLHHVIDKSGFAENQTNYNSDTATNYAVRRCPNGGSDLTSTSYASTRESTTAYDVDDFGVTYIVNIATEEKLSIGFFIDQRAAGAGTAPERTETVNKWSNTSNTITNINRNLNNSETQASDSNLSVLGSDGTEELNVQDGAIYYDTDLNKEYVLYNNTWTEI